MYKILICLILAGCTIDVTVTETSGSGTDVIETAQSPKNDLEPKLETPLIGK